MLTFEEMKELIHLVAGNKLGGVEVREGDFHFRVTAVAEPLASPARAPDASAESLLAQAPLAEPPPEPEVEGHILSSPIVGTFYAAPNPDGAESERL